MQEKLLSYCRYSLRTLIIVVTVGCVWLGYQVNWIRERRAAIASGRVEYWRDEFDNPFDNASPTPVSPPFSLWIFGERGRDTICLHSCATDQEVSDMSALFPEAWVFRSYEGQVSDP